MRSKKCNANTDLDVIQKLNLKQEKKTKMEREKMKKVHNIAIYICAMCMEHETWAMRDTWWYIGIRMQNVTEVPYENIFNMVLCFLFCIERCKKKNEKWMTGIFVVAPINEEKKKLVQKYCRWPSDQWMCWMLAAWVLVLLDDSILNLDMKYWVRKWAEACSESSSPNNQHSATNIQPAQHWMLYLSLASDLASFAAHLRCTTKTR